MAKAPKRGRKRTAEVTLGKPKSAASRQQIRAGQRTQTGSDELDRASADSGRSRQRAKR